MPKDDTVFQRLEMATDAELQAVVNHLRIKKFPEDRKTLIEFLSKKYRDAGGHSLVNVFRDDHELSYKTILIDVANRMKPAFLIHFANLMNLDLGKTNYKLKDSSTEENIENAIYEYFKQRLDDALKKMSEKKRAKVAQKVAEDLGDRGFTEEETKAAYEAVMSGAISNSSFEMMAFHMIYASIFPVLLRSASLLRFGPLGIAIIAVWTTISIGGPAYRKTIPTTLALIMIRNRNEAEDRLG